MTVYTVTESKVYHSRADCPPLRRNDRYWPLKAVKYPPPGLRLCALCQRRDAP